MTKKIKCNHCGAIIVADKYDNNPKGCSCGKVTLIKESVISGVCGSDWTDVSPILLTE